MLAGVEGSSFELMSRLGGKYPEHAGWAPRLTEGGAGTPSGCEAICRCISKGVHIIGAPLGLLVYHMERISARNSITNPPRQTCRISSLCQPL